MKVLTWTVALAALLVALAGAAWADGDGARARLDQDTVALGESVRLQVEVSGEHGDAPDWTPLGPDFEMAGDSVSHRTVIINGRMESSSVYTVTLIPRRAGTLEIPALQAGQLYTEPLKLTILPVGSSPTGRGRRSGQSDLFIESELEPDSPYVQGMARLTVRIFIGAIDLMNASLTDPESPDALIERLGEDRKYETRRNGRRFQVIERRYALFFQTSGAHELPGAILNGQVPDRRAGAARPFDDFFRHGPFGPNPFAGLMTAARPVRLQGESRVVAVRPRPDQASGADWLPAHNLVLQQRWQGGGERIAVGEPLTRVVEIRAQGLQAAQLPDLEAVEVEGLKVYPDPPELESRVYGEEGDAPGIQGLRRQSIAYMPTRPGRFEIPPIQLRWWDLESDSERTTELPGRIIDVLPAPGTDNLPTETAPRTDSPAVGEAGAGEASGSSDPGEGHLGSREPGEAGSGPIPTDAGAISAGAASETSAPLAVERASPWPWISLLLALLWVGTMILWLKGRGVAVASLDGARPGPSFATARAEPARRAFLEACAANDPAEARRTLLAWAAAHWPDDPPLGLSALAKRLPDPGAKRLLTALDRALYQRDSGVWDGVKLAGRLSQLPGRSRSAKGPDLPSLYS